jgi:type II restriction enzyme
MPAAQEEHTKQLATGDEPAIRRLITRWRDDQGATYQSWFLWNERLKNFRSIRRGLSEVVNEIEAGTFGSAYKGGLKAVLAVSQSLSRQA